MSSEQHIVEALLGAYRQGAFPMADAARGTVDWYSPDPRALMPLEMESVRGKGDGFHISRSLAKRMREKPFVLTADRAFERVIRECAKERRAHEGSWIDGNIVHWYTLLHRHGHAHSVEAWLPNGEGAPEVLVGGIYGVAIGRAFFAESMFSRPRLGGTDASKVCLVRLVEHLRACGYQLMDVQLRNEHTDQFGVYEVRRGEYMRMLAEAVDAGDAWRGLEGEEAGG